MVSVVIADSAPTRGWFVGHFLDPAAGVRHTADVELKWGVHLAGESRYLDDGTTETPQSPN